MNFGLVGFGIEVPRPHDCKKKTVLPSKYTVISVEQKKKILAANASSLHWFPPG